ncbi:MAG: RsmE family RNA methyltransferase [Phycisphaerales bacterium]
MPDPRPIAHCMMFSDLAAASSGDRLTVTGEEAHHAAKVKRIREGEAVALLDGRGRMAVGAIAEIAGSKSRPELAVLLESIETVPPVSPVVEVCAALPKGDRLDRMVDQLTQLGVHGFRPLLCERSQRKPETVRTDKLERIAAEAMKQCRRPWSMDFRPPITFGDALGDPDAVVADASGEGFFASDARPRTTLLVGPEGGWSPAERELIEQRGVRTRRFGVFVLRIEAAACAASAIVLSHAPPPAHGRI